MEVKAVIFDLDGTLIDSIEDIADANNKMLSDFGFPVHDVKEYIKWIGNGARLLVEASLPPKERGGDIARFLNKYNNYYQQNTHNKSSVFTGIDKVLDALTEKEIPMAINTNKPQNLTDAVVGYYLKKWPFKSVIGHSNTFPHKPNPKGALHFAKQVNCDPKHVLLIGDSVVDIQTAKAAGMMPLGVSWGYGQPCIEGDCLKIVNHPQEILDFIENNINEASVKEI